MKWVSIIAGSVFLFGCYDSVMHTQVSGHRKIKQYNLHIFCFINVIIHNMKIVITVLCFVIVHSLQRESMTNIYLLEVTLQQFHKECVFVFVTNLLL